MTKEELDAHVREVYGVEKDYPFSEDDVYVYRHRTNRKWFGLVMRVPYRKLGLEKDGAADVLNVKCGPLLQGSFLSSPGVFPAWHMNKEHWLSVLLDGTAPARTVEELVAGSHGLTKKKTRAPKAREEDA